MDKFEKVSLALILLLVFVGLVIAFYDLAMYDDLYVKEDGFIEWLSVLGLLSGAGLSLYRALKIKSSKGLLFLSGLLIFAALFTFGAGEEISWGQRIFDVKSPEFFAKHNSQGETNIHNLIIEGKKINKIVFGTFLGICIATYLLILPVLYRKKEGIKRLVDRLALPVPQNRHILSYLLLFILVSITPSAKKGELLEFGGCWLFFLIHLIPYNSEIYRLESGSSESV